MGNEQSIVDEAINALAQIDANHDRHQLANQLQSLMVNYVEPDKRQAFLADLILIINSLA